MLILLGAFLDIPGSLWFSQFSGCWLILSVYILSLCKIVRSSVILLLPLYTATSKQSIENRETVWRSNRLDETEFFSQFFVFFQLVPQNKHGLSMFGIHFTGTYTYSGKSSYCIYKNNSFIVEPKIVPISRENIINNLLGYIIVQ